MAEKKLNGTVIVTYRCNARCTMCNRYKAPSRPDEEISIETIKLFAQRQTHKVIKAKNIFSAGLIFFNLDA